MSNVIAVVGSGFGDCGKGLMTDFFSAQYDNAVVIRSNGGAQSGHTVVTPEGQRHVFSHFGSGTFNNTPTFLSKYFVVNPMLFEKEHRAFIEEFDIIPEIYIDPLCAITTPYDMLLNQRFEHMRGMSKHGSCGVGFGETIERNLVHSELLIDDLYRARMRSNSEFLNRITTELESIRNEYVPSRINIKDTTGEFKAILDSEELITDFFNSMEYLFNNVDITIPNYFKSHQLIFEGAQGLLLDMDYGYFPHVTRSNCGMKNISQILSKIDGEHGVTANYVTRAYTTRHGAGPLAHERDWDIEGRYNIVDDTNITNEFQDSLRFAPLDFELLNSITDKDFLNYAPRGSKKNIVMTCMDQLSENDVITYQKRSAYMGNTLHRLSKEVFETNMNKFADYLSYGPTRDDVRATGK